MSVEKGNGLVCLGIPRERLLLPEFVDSRDLLIHQLKEDGIYGGVIQQPGCRIELNRNRIVDEFLKDERQAEFLLYLDNDMQFPVEIGTALSAHRLPVVGGTYFKTGNTFEPVAYRFAKIQMDDYGRPARYYQPLYDEVFDYLEAHNLPRLNRPIYVSKSLYDPLVECDALGTGAMMIHRSVLEDLDPPWFEFAGINGEDLNFCDRVKKELGHPIYLDRSILCGHITPIALGQTQFRDTFHQRGVEVTRYGQHHIMEWLQEFYNLDEDGAKRMLDVNSVKRQARLWQKMNPQTAEQVQEFYRNRLVGRWYVTDLIRWNMSPMFQGLRGYLTPYRECKVLEIGSGIGTIAYQMAVQRCDVTAVEINPLLRRFAEYRWKWQQDHLSEFVRRGYVHFTDCVPNDGEYDLVIAVDVFEHIHADQLPGMLREIGGLLKERGMLFHHNNWEQRDIFPFHYDHSESWEGWLDDAGLFEVQPPFWTMKVG